MSEQDPAQSAGEENRSGAQFSLQRIYLKDLSFESPRAPQTFRNQYKPKVNMELNSRHSEVENSLYEVVLSLTVTARDESDNVLFLIEIQQAGLFMVSGFQGDALNHTLGAFCPNVLFPYARETIDSVVVKGSFPPLMLAPVNFDAIYEQSKAQRERQQTTVQ